MKTMNEATTDPVEHSRNFQKQLRELIDHAKKDIGGCQSRDFRRSSRPPPRSGGLRTAFEHYEEGREKAWRR